MTRILCNVDSNQCSQSLTQAETKRECKRLGSSSLQSDGQSEKAFPEDKLITS